VPGIQGVGRYVEAQVAANLEEIPRPCPPRLLRQTAVRLFAPQRDYGIDARRTARRHVARREGYGRKKRRRSGKTERIGRSDLVQKAPQHPRDAKRGQKTEADPNHRQFRRLAEDQSEHMCACGAQGDADANLLRPPRHRVRHDAVDADRR